MAKMIVMLKLIEQAYSVEVRSPFPDYKVIEFQEHYL